MKPAQRRIRDNMARGQTSYGAAVQLPCPDIVEIVGYTGFDFAWIDAEHGGFDLGDIRTLVRAADAARIDSIVRVPNHEPTYIQRVLDMGAGGVMVPRISTTEQGRAVVAASHYAPGGTRGACPCGRAFAHRMQDPSTELDHADREVLVFGIIEDPAGVENVEEIAGSCGFDGLLFGPFDLSIELGLRGDIRHPDVNAMRKRVIDATRAAGIEVFSANAAWEPDLQGARAGLVAVLGDRDAMVEHFRHRLGETRTLLEGPKPVVAKLELGTV